MAQYRLIFNFIEGAGIININGTDYRRGDIFIEEATTLNITIIPDAGFTFGEAIFNNLLIAFNDNPFTIVMPPQDSRLVIKVFGVPEPEDEYGLRYFSEFCDITGKDVRVEILEDGFTGLAEKRKIEGCNFRFGSFGGDQFETFVNSSFDFGLYGNINEFIDMLDGGNRKFMVKIFLDSVLFWEGYLNNSIFNWALTANDQAIRFTASDGLNSLDAIRMIESFFFAFRGNTALSPIVSGLNQSFVDKRPVNIANSIYETRMDRFNEGVFEQFLWPANAIFTKGEQPIYTGDGGIVENTSVTIKEGIENLVRPFLCRVFLWKNEFYVISVPEFNKNSYKLFRYSNDGTLLNFVTISPNNDIGCRNADGTASAIPVFTEFIATLELGEFDENARGGIYEVAFNRDSFVISSPATPVWPNTLFLANWLYIRSRPASSVSTYPTDGTALVQYVNDSLGERVKIWGTTSAVGLADPNLSWFQLQQDRIGQDLAIAQEGANKISFSIEFMAEPRTSSITSISNARCGILLQIGGQRLLYDNVTNTFSWTTNQSVFDIMQFPLTTLNTWNKLDIVGVPVPETGPFVIRLYEIIAIASGAVNNYAISFRNLSFKIEQNNELSLATISRKAITEVQYSNVYPEYKIAIGDVPTANSTSAIKLDITNNPPSELWSRDGVEQLPLLEIIVRELANFRGRQNPRYILTLVRDANNDPFELDAYRNIQYDGFNWMINAMEVDLFRNLWKIEIIRLGEI